MARARGQTFERGRVTDMLLSNLTTALDASSILVGDNLAPPTAAWTGGEPGKGDFIPYVVLTTAPAIRNSSSVLGSDDTDDWSAQYKLASYGGLRDQVDWVADQARRAWYQLPRGRQDVGWLIDDARESWKIYDYSIASLGGIDRVDQSNPPTWQLIDSVALGITR